MLLLASTLTYAQVTTSSMSGIVADEKGEPLIGASVVAIHTPSGTEYGTITDVKGNYRIVNMRPGGPYTVSFSYLGYNTMKVTEGYLALAENTVLNGNLNENSIELGTVEIVGSRYSNMSSDQAGAVTNIGRNAINTLPTISRSFTDLTRLTPQANGAAIGGGTYRQNNITIDGASFNNKFGIGQSMPANGSPISLDAIEQISVSVTPYDVRQSGFLGASVNAVTRSGDNEFKGSVYTYLNNEKFKGNKVKDQTFDRTESSYNLYGVRFGGPIIKNKLFFFVNYETEKTQVPGPSRTASTNSNPYDAENNVARPTAADMDMISKYLMDTYGYETGPYQGYANESPGMKLLARVDWNINKNHRINIRYNITKKKDPYTPSTSISGISPTPYASSNNRTGMWAMWYKNSGYYQEQNFSSIAGELNSKFGKVNNLLRFTYTDQDEPRSTDGNQFPFIDILKDGTPYVSFGTELFSFGNLRKVSSYTFSDDVTFNWGINHFTAGLQYEHNMTKNGFQRFGTGYYAFNSWDDFVQGKTAKSFSLTHPNNTALEQAFPSFEFNQLTAYIQDELSFSERLNLLIGLRYDLPVYPKLNTYNQSVADLDFGGRTFNTGELPNANLMFSPRVGFNYDLLGDRSLVLRGGSGLFTGTIPFVWIVSQASDAGVLQTTVTATSLGTVEVPKIPAFKTDLTGILNEVYPGGFNPSTPVLPSQVTIMDKDLTLPQNWKSSLALDAKLPYGILGTLEGIYSTDINSVVVENAGLTPETFTIANYSDQRAISTRTYYQRLNNVYLLKNGGSNYYWSITAKAEKAFDFGLSAMVAYTHSNGKSSRDGIGDQVGSAWYNDPTAFGSNDYTMGYSGYVIPNRLIASLSYRKEYGKYFGTSVSLFYTGAAQGRFSYVHDASYGGLVNDGGGSSLIYIPKDPSEFSFADYTYNNSANQTVTYTAADQSTDFWNYINQDKYLSEHKGEYVLRNGALYPWVNSFDIKIMQDFFVNVSGKRNTIQVGLDIMNIGNLLNSNWGIQNYYNMNNFLRITNMSAVAGGRGTVAPTYNFKMNSSQKLTETFRPNIGYASTYYMQLSLRYIFN
jgi:hypothetical protein